MRHGLLTIVVVLMGCATAMAQSGPAFSSLEAARQNELRRLAEPPPPAQRSGPYSTPMYYLMNQGYSYRGGLDHPPEKRTYKRLRGEWGPDYGNWDLDRNRPDWQEAMIRDWAELGLNSTHLNIHPREGSLQIADTYRQAIEDFVRLSAKHGLRIGVRLDPPAGRNSWELHPNNPDNRLEEYLDYAREVAALLKGQALYYVLGDELTLHQPAEDLDPELWTPRLYLDYFRKAATAIKQVDPQTRVSMFAPSSGEWFNVLWLLENGYADVGDAVAINYYDYRKVHTFFDDARKLAPNLMFLSNGVGYISTATAEPRYPEGDPYSRHATEESHAQAVAKTMFAWWDLRADVAPYYITLRNWVMQDKVYPRWYGFFGIQDFVVDEHEQMTIKRYPGWYAFQTIAHTFYNRDEFTEPKFEVATEGKPSMLRVYEHVLPNGASEALVMLWHDEKDPVEVKLTLGDPSLRYAVEPDLYNFRRWRDVAYEVDESGVSLSLNVSRSLRIIRLFRLPQ